MEKLSSFFLGFDWIGDATRGISMNDSMTIQWTSSLIGAFLAIVLACAGGESSIFAQGIEVRIDHGHPWRPPFGLERVGRPLMVLITTPARPLATNQVLTVRSQGKEIGRHPVHFTGDPPYSIRVPLEPGADELILSYPMSEEQGHGDQVVQSLRIPELEADAIARADPIVNPVDLGTILVPSDWLLLGPGQSATLDVTAISRERDYPQARLTAGSDSASQQTASAPMPLRKSVLTRLQLKPPEARLAEGHHRLTVTLDDGQGRAIWVKTINVMMVSNPPRRPIFGATYERLRYDAPISVRDPRTGSFSTMPYERGWNSELQDVVVWLPNGARFVFWRGSSYIPFWAGKHNTGACYEWAEIISQPAGAVDCVEPLMDKELRVQSRRDHRIVRGPGPCPLDLSVHRLQLQGLGRRRCRGLLLLSRRIRHEGCEPQGRSQE